ncbi:MAG: GTPase Era [Acidobacteria bacterium]|nr:GTPase Era [Acidobacteriota bacterium]
MPFHSGFVAIIGPPNAGKSTLLNALAGEKLAIVSPKPQTTRNRVLGVMHVPKKAGREAAQLVLIDTPGVHRPLSSLGRKMMAEAREALAGCDLILVITDAARPEASDEFLFHFLKRVTRPAFLLLNKIDLVREKSRLLPLIERRQRQHDFREIVPISARKREGLDLLIDKLVEALPQGPRYFPEDQITDQPVRFMAAELIREQVLLRSREEVPHSVTVLVDEFAEGPRITRIAATIYCDREGQKAILIGSQGRMLTAIGSAARKEIERMLETKVFLELYVKVQANWRESRAFVEQLDWRRQLDRLLPADAGRKNSN